MDEGSSVEYTGQRINKNFTLKKEKRKKKKVPSQKQKEVEM